MRSDIVAGASRMTILQKLPCSRLSETIPCESRSENQVLVDAVMTTEPGHHVSNSDSLV
jgi:hypothetical protein